MSELSHSHSSQGIADVAKNVYDIGTQYDQKITDVYNAITELGQHWSGTVYDTLTANVRGYEEDLKKLSTLLTQDIPDSLNTVASNFAADDEASLEIANRLKSYSNN